MTRALRQDFIWYISAFVSGSVNAGGYLASFRFVTHVTGFATLFATESLNARWRDAVELLTVPIFFILGAMISGYLIDRRMRRGQRPQFGPALGLVALALYVTAVGGHAGWFGPFGEAPEVAQDYWLLSLLCMSSGLHNALVTSASRARARVTHLTGVTTDLGVGLMRMLGGDLMSQDALAEIQLNLFRAGIIVSFILGGVVSGALFLRYEYIAFLLPAGLVSGLVFVTRLFWDGSNVRKARSSS